MTDKYYIIIDPMVENINKNSSGGLRIHDLDKFISTYSKTHDAIYGIKFISKEIPINKINIALTKYKNKTFPKKYEMFLSYVLFFVVNVVCQMNIKIPKLYNKDKIMCTEFVHDFLYECGVLKSYPSHMFWPSMIENSNFKKLEHISYSPIHHFIK